MIVEPFANDRLEDNLNPVGRIFYSASTLHLHAGVALAGGRAVPRRAGRRGAAAQASSTEGGFTRFRRAAETPFNLIFEARP